MLTTNLDLPEQHGTVVILEGKGTYDQSVQKDSHGPDVCSVSLIVTTGNEFRSSIGWTSTTGREHVGQITGLCTETEVDDSQL